MKNRPVIGQVLFSLAVGNAARRHNEPVVTTIKVSKIGRKYFTCVTDDKYKWERIYHLDNWREKTDCSPNSKLYESEQAILDEFEASKLYQKIKYDFFDSYRSSLIPLEKLKQIKEILKDL